MIQKNLRGVTTAGTRMILGQDIAFVHNVKKEEIVSPKMQKICEYILWGIVVILVFWLGFKES